MVIERSLASRKKRSLLPQLLPSEQRCRPRQPPHRRHEVRRQRRRWRQRSKCHAARCWLSYGSSLTSTIMRPSSSNWYDNYCALGACDGVSSNDNAPNNPFPFPSHIAIPCLDFVSVTCYSSWVARLPRPLLPYPTRFHGHAVLHWRKQVCVSTYVCT